MAVTSIAKLSNTAKLRLLLLVFCGMAVLVAHWPSTDHTVRRLALRLDDLLRVNGIYHYPVWFTGESESIKGELRKLGAKAVPVLLRMLAEEPGRSDELLKKVTDWSAKRWSWWTWRHDPRARVTKEKMAGIYALGALGVDALPAATPLAEELKSVHGHIAAWALGEIGKGALPALAAGLTNQSALVREHSLFGLEPLGSDAKSLYPRVRVMVADPVPDIRCEAARIIGNTVPSMTNAFRDLAPLQQDVEPEVRASYAAGIGMAARHLQLPPDDPDLKEAAAILAGLLTSSDWEVRAKAAGGMMWLKEAAAPHISGLLHCLDDADERVFLAATDALGRLRIEPAAVVPVLASKLDTEMGSRRLYTAVTLRGYGPPAEKFYPGAFSKLGSFGRKEFQTMEEAWKKYELSRKR